MTQPNSYRSYLSKETDARTGSRGQSNKSEDYQEGIQSTRKSLHAHYDHGNGLSLPFSPFRIRQETVKNVEEKEALTERGDKMLDDPDSLIKLVEKWLDTKVKHSRGAKHDGKYQKDFDDSLHTFFAENNQSCIPDVCEYQRIHKEWTFKFDKDKEYLVPMRHLMIKLYVNNEVDAFLMNLGQLYNAKSKPQQLINDLEDSLISQYNFRANLVSGGDWKAAKPTRNNIFSHLQPKQFPPVQSTPLIPDLAAQYNAMLTLALIFAQLIASHTQIAEVVLGANCDYHTRMIMPTLASEGAREEAEEQHVEQQQKLSALLNISLETLVTFVQQKMTTTLIKLTSNFELTVTQFILFSQFMSEVARAFHQKLNIDMGFFLTNLTSIQQNYLEQLTHKRQDQLIYILREETWTSITVTHSEQLMVDQIGSIETPKSNKSLISDKEHLLSRGKPFKVCRSLINLYQMLTELTVVMRAWPDHSQLSTSRLTELIDLYITKTVEEVTYLRTRQTLSEERDRHAQDCIEFVERELPRIESFCADYHVVSVKFDGLGRQLEKAGENFETERKRVKSEAMLKRLQQIEESQEEHDVESSPGMSQRRVLVTDDSNEGGDESRSEKASLRSEKSTPDKKLQQELRAIQTNRTEELIRCESPHITVVEQYTQRIESPPKIALVVPTEPMSDIGVDSSEILTRSVVTVSKEDSSEGQIQESKTTNVQSKETQPEKGINTNEVTSKETDKETYVPKEEQVESSKSRNRHGYHTSSSQNHKNSEKTVSKKSPDKVQKSEKIASKKSPDRLQKEKKGKKTLKHQLQSSKKSNSTEKKTVTWTLSQDTSPGKQSKKEKMKEILISKKIIEEPNMIRSQQNSSGEASVKTIQETNVRQLTKQDSSTKTITTQDNAGKITNNMTSEQRKSSAKHQSSSTEKAHKTVQELKELHSKQSSSNITINNVKKKQKLKVQTRTTRTENSSDEISPTLTQSKHVELMNVVTTEDRPSLHIITRSVGSTSEEGKPKSRPQTVQTSDPSVSLNLADHYQVIMKEVNASQNASSSSAGFHYDKLRNHQQQEAMLLINNDTDREKILTPSQGMYRDVNIFNEGNSVSVVTFSDEVQNVELPHKIEAQAQFVNEKDSETSSSSESRGVVVEAESDQETEKKQEASENLNEEASSSEDSDTSQTSSSDSSSSSSSTSSEEESPSEPELQPYIPKSILRESKNTSLGDESSSSDIAAPQQVQKHISKEPPSQSTPANSKGNPYTTVTHPSPEQSADHIAISGADRTTSKMNSSATDTFHQPPNLPRHSQTPFDAKRILVDVNRTSKTPAGKGHDDEETITVKPTSTTVRGQAHEGSIEYEDKLSVSPPSGKKEEGTSDEQSPPGIEQATPQFKGPESPFDVEKYQINLTNMDAPTFFEPQSADKKPLTKKQRIEKLKKEQQKLKEMEEKTKKSQEKKNREKNKAYMQQISSERKKQEEMKDSRRQEKSLERRAKAEEKLSRRREDSQERKQKELEESIQSFQEEKTKEREKLLIMKKKELYQAKEAEKQHKKQQRLQKEKVIEYEEKACQKDKFNQDSDLMISQLYESNFELKQQILRLQQQERESLNDKRQTKGYKELTRVSMNVLRGKKANKDLKGEIKKAKTALKRQDITKVEVGHSFSLSPRARKMLSTQRIHNVAQMEDSMDLKIVQEIDKVRYEKRINAALHEELEARMKGYGFSPYDTNSLLKDDHDTPQQAQLKMYLKDEKEKHNLMLQERAMDQQESMQQHQVQCKQEELKKLYEKQICVKEQPSDPFMPIMSDSPKAALKVASRFNRNRNRSTSQTRSYQRNCADDWCNKQQSAARLYDLQSDKPSKLYDIQNTQNGSISNWVQHQSQLNQSLDVSRLKSNIFKEVPVAYAMKYQQIPVNQAMVKMKTRNSLQVTSRESRSSRQSSNKVIPVPSMSPYHKKTREMKYWVDQYESLASGSQAYPMPTDQTIAKEDNRDLSEISGEAQTRLNSSPKVLHNKANESGMDMDQRESTAYSIPYLPRVRDKKGRNGSEVLDPYVNALQSQKQRLLNTKLNRANSLSGARTERLGQLSSFPYQSEQTNQYPLQQTTSERKLRKSCQGMKNFSAIKGMQSEHRHKMILQSLPPVFASMKQLLQ